MFIGFDGIKKWYNKKGQYHREDGPAFENTYGDKYWYKEGRRHREDGPAVEYANGRKEYWKNNKALTEKELNEIGLSYSRCKRCNRDFIDKINNYF